jgi:hypothetical protein
VQAPQVHPEASGPLAPTSFLDRDSRAAGIPPWRGTCATLIIDWFGPVAGHDQRGLADSGLADPASPLSIRVRHPRWVWISRWRA